MTTPLPAERDSQSSFEGQLAAFRELVAPLIRESVPDREPRRHLYDMIGGQLSREGKGIRPALCIATCRAFGGDANRVLPSAAALELLHNALLVHDDIEDSSEYRRDHPTLHRQYGVPLAVNAGDAMNAMSVRMLRRNLPLLGPELSWRVFDEFDHMTIETIEGQAMELGWICDNNCETTEADYLLLVLKKTCWYSFIQPCRIGAIVAGRDPSHLSGFDRFGFFLGAAFQIQDDVLNLVGDRKKYGKEIGGDILEGKRTLILAHLFRSCDESEKRRLKTFLGKSRTQRLPREVAWILDALRNHGSIEHARQVAYAFAHTARTEFDCAYQGASNTEDLGFLRHLLDYMVDREV